MFRYVMGLQYLSTKTILGLTSDRDEDTGIHYTEYVRP